MHLYFNRIAPKIFLRRTNVINCIYTHTYVLQILNRILLQYLELHLCNHDATRTKYVPIHSFGEGKITEIRGIS